MEPMSLTFQSKSLGRQITIEDLNLLGADELNNLNAELTLAQESIDNRLEKEQELIEKYGQRENTIEYSDWMHKVNFKRRIVITFRTAVTQILNNKDNLPPLEELARDKFEELLIEELGERLYREMREEARELAAEDLRARIRDASLHARRTGASPDMPPES